jgi:hypothetical protein
LSPELAAGISRVKGVKQLGFRSGNWLTAEQCSQVLKHAGGSSLRAKRDHAMLAMLFGCGLRRSELAGLQVDDVQMRQGHWAIVDMIGKGGHIRTVPIPAWVKASLDEWAAQAGITQGRMFRAVGKTGKVWGKGVSQNVVWYVVKTCCEKAGLQHIAPHDLRRTCAKLCHSNGGELEQIQFLLGHASVQTTERYLGCKQNLGHPVNDLFDLGADIKLQATSSEPVAFMPVENGSRRELECRHGGSEYAAPIPLLRTGQPSHRGRTEAAKVGTGDRSENLRSCSQSGIAEGNPVGKTDSGRDQAAFGPMGDLTQRRKEIDHSVKTTERYLGCKQNLGNSADDRSAPIANTPNSLANASRKRTA